MEKPLRVVRSEDEIRGRIHQLAGEIRAAAVGELTVVGILDDAFVFLADLIRALETPISCCFMKVTRHRHGGQSEVMFTSEFDPRGREELRISNCELRIEEPETEELRISNGELRIGIAGSRIETVIKNGRMQIRDSKFAISHGRCASQ